MSQIDQEQQHAVRMRQPRNQVSASDEAMVMDFDGRFSAFRSFGPFNKAMDTAPLTHITVPTILAIDLQLRIFTFSILVFMLVSKSKKNKSTLEYTLHDFKVDAHLLLHTHLITLHKLLLQMSLLEQDSPWHLPLKNLLDINPRMLDSDSTQFCNTIITKYKHHFTSLKFILPN